MLLSSYKTQGLKTTILLSGLMFGLMHMNIEQFFYATLIGFFFGYITCKTSSIYPAMIFHFMNNGLSCLFSFASVNEIKWLDFFGFMTNMASTNTFLYLIFFLTLVAICVFVVQMLIPQLMKNTNFKTAENIGKQLAKYKLRAEYFEGLKNLAGEDSKLNKDIDEMLEETSLELEYELYNVSREQMFEYQIKKTKNFDKPTKILVIATICLQAVVTLFTFIWGIF